METTDKVEGFLQPQVLDAGICDGGLQTSPQIDKLAEALSNAQAAYQALPKTRTVTVRTLKGGSYSFQYAPLDSVIDAARPALCTNGLSFIQSVQSSRSSRPKPEISESEISVTTLLMHKSGQWIKNTLSWSSAMQSIQDAGAFITYLRRYALSAILGLASEDDTDGPPQKRQASQDDSPASSPEDIKLVSEIKSLWFRYVSDKPSKTEDRIAAFDKWGTSILGKSPISWSKPEAWTPELVEKAKKAIELYRSVNEPKQEPNSGGL